MKYWCLLLLLWNRKCCYIWVCKSLCVTDMAAGWCFIFFGCEAVELQIIVCLLRRCVFTLGMVSVLSQLCRHAAGWIRAAVTERMVPRRDVYRRRGQLCTKPIELDCPDLWTLLLVAFVTAWKTRFRWLCCASVCALASQKLRIPSSVTIIFWKELGA